MSKVKVIARLRPTLPGEAYDNAINIHDHQNCSEPPTSYISLPDRDGKETLKFDFASCFDQTSTQAQVFDRDVRPLLSAALSGMSVTVMAYGVTSSGKTFTMQGNKTDPGIIPRIVQGLLERQYKTGLQPTYSMTYVEIYKEDVFDLLVPRNKAQKLFIRERNSQFFVEKSKSCPFTSVKEFQTLHSRATTQRSVGSTNLNNESSRSHAILTLEIVVPDHERNITLHGKINLVDLAGSENNKVTGNDSSRMAESASINKSLTTLGKVVRALNSGEPVIPYRESSLTRILKNSLGGEAICLLICNIAPGTKLRSETKNTLHFASQARKVENKPVANIQRAPPKREESIDVPEPDVPRSLSQSRELSRTKPPSPPSFQPLAVVNESGETLLTMSTNELQAMIERAVKEGIEKHLKAENEIQQELVISRPKSLPLVKQELQTLPAGVLTPILKHHAVSEEELRGKLDDLETIVCRGNNVPLSNVLSPVSGKKAARAYVMLARMHSDKKEYHLSLQYYKKAETLVPENKKLRERILDLEYCIKNGKSLPSSPTKPSKEKSKDKPRKKSKSSERRYRLSCGEEEAISAPMLTSHALSRHTTSSKRYRTENDDGVTESPVKKLKKARSDAIPHNGDDDEEMKSPISPVKGKRRIKAMV